MFRFEEPAYLYLLLLLPVLASTYTRTIGDARPSVSSAIRN